MVAVYCYGIGYNPYRVCIAYYTYYSSTDLVTYVFLFVLYNINCRYTSGKVHFYQQ